VLNAGVCSCLRLKYSFVLVVCRFASLTHSSIAASTTLHRQRLFSDDRSQQQQQCQRVATAAGVGARVSSRQEGARIQPAEAVLAKELEADGTKELEAVEAGVRELY